MQRDESLLYDIVYSCHRIIDYTIGLELKLSSGWGRFKTP